LTVPVDTTPRIQEAHLLMVHILCDLVEKGLFQSGLGLKR
jgi:D-sedoheptulose 7-phosphate isomerase